MIPEMAAVAVTLIASALTSLCDGGLPALPFVRKTKEMARLPRGCPGHRGAGKSECLVENWGLGWDLGVEDDELWERAAMGV